MTAENKKKMTDWFIYSNQLFEEDEKHNDSLMHKLHKQALTELQKEDTDEELLKELLDQMKTLAMINKTIQENDNYDLESNL
jgi:hypothetical protein